MTFIILRITAGDDIVVYFTLNISNMSRSKKDIMINIFYSPGINRKQHTNTHVMRGFCPLVIKNYKGIHSSFP